MSEVKTVEQIKEELSKVSPLALPGKLIDYEIADMKSSQATLDDVYDEFEKSGGKDGLVKSLTLNVLDGVIKPLKLSSKGITATRLYNECTNFSYNVVDVNDHIMTIQQRNDARQGAKDSSENTKRAKSKYDRNSNKKQGTVGWEDADKMEAYSEKHYNGKVRAENEFRVDDNNNAQTVYGHKKGEYSKVVEKHDNKGNSTMDKKSSPDHIVPLKKMFDEHKGNYALSDQELKDIMNSDDNFAVIDRRLNQAKGDMTNEEFIKTSKGKVVKELNQKTKDKMIQKGKEAQRKIDKKVNKTVVKNLMSNGNGASKKLAGDSYKKAKDVAKDPMIGEAIIFVVKPLMFEVTDIFKNGMSHGVAGGFWASFKFRLARAKDYIFENLKDFFSDGISQFLKIFFSCLVEGIINLLAGVVKKIMSIIKEGFSTFVEAIKILAKPSSEMSGAQKADAVSKLLVGVLMGYLGITLNTWLDTLGFIAAIPGLSEVIATIITGVGTTFLMYFLDKVDLFSVKSEKRSARVKEVFDERIKNIKESTKNFDLATHEILKEQRIQFEGFKASLRSSLDKKDMTAVNKALDGVADFLHVKIPYSSSKEFVEYLHNNKKIVIS